VFFYGTDVRDAHKSPDLCSVVRSAAVPTTP
jgi:hypothetical protein